MTNLTAGNRVAAVLAGEVPLKDLTGEELSVVNALITSNIEAAVAASNFGPDLAAAGITTVSLDERGRVVEHRPDGSTTVLE